MSLVVDSSVAMAWAVKDEASARADSVLETVTKTGGHVPFLFPAEFANGLTMAVRRGRTDSEARREALNFVQRLGLAHDLEGPGRLPIVIELADTYGLTVYDAFYLDLAQRHGLSLATFDRKLAAAARQAMVQLAVPEA